MFLSVREDLIIRHNNLALFSHFIHFCLLINQDYVHQLLQNVNDGKIVETHNPDNTMTHGIQSLVTPSISGNGGNLWSLIKEEMEDGWDVVN